MNLKDVTIFKLEYSDERKNTAIKLPQSNLVAEWNLEKPSRTAMPTWFFFFFSRAVNTLIRISGFRWLKSLIVVPLQLKLVIGESKPAILS